MYPYFQKKQAASINSREAAPTDPLRQFLTQNSQFGTLLFQVTGGQGSVPIANATVVISKSLPNGYMLSITATTDESGKTEEFSLPAPSRTLSQIPGTADVFSTYHARISAPGTVSAVVHDIPIFDGVTTIQPVSLSFDVGGEQKNKVNSVTDTEPTL